MPKMKTKKGAAKRFKKDGYWLQKRLRQQKSYLDKNDNQT